MSRSGSISLDWADGHHTFRYGWRELQMLQEALDCGPYVVLVRLSDHTWLVQDISHVIRIALIGGGLTPEKALSLVRDYVETRPPIENVWLAKAILTAALIGVPDEPATSSKKKASRKAKGSTASQTESSASQ